MPGTHDLRRPIFQPFKLLKDSVRLHVDSAEIDVAV